MAAFFWIGGTGTWNAISLLNWSSTSGGIADKVAVPGSGDTVTFDASSGGGTVTVNTNFNVTSVTMGAFTGTLDFSANNNSPTMQTFNGSGTGTRTFNMGNGTWTLTGNATTIFTIATTTNLTFNPGTSIVDSTYSGSTGTRALVTGASAAFGLYDVKISAGAGGLSLTTTFFCRSLNFSGFTGVWNPTAVTVAGNITFGTGMTRTSGGSSTLTLSGTGSQTITWNGVNLLSNVTIDATGGTYTLQDDLTIDSAHQLQLTNGTFDANNKNLTLGLFSSSNSNTRVLTMGSGTWTLTGNNATIWTTSTSTGLTITGGNVVCNYSGSTGTRTITSRQTTSISERLNMSISAGSDIIVTTGTYTVNNLNFTGFTGTWNPNSATFTSGNVILGTGMTYGATGSTWKFDSLTSGNTITSNNVVVNSTITFDGVDGSWTLQDNLDMSGASNKTITITNGSFNSNNKNVTCGAVSSSNSNIRTLTMGSGTWTLTGTGTVWNTATTTNLTLNQGTGTIVANDASSSSKTISSGVTILNNLVFSGGGTGTFIIGTTTGTSTFKSISVLNPPHTVQIFAGKQLTILSPELCSWSGTAGSLNTFQSTSSGGAWTISAALGIMSQDDISLQDSTATGGATFYAGAQSTNVSNNTGWLFQSSIGNRPTVESRLVVREFGTALAFNGSSNVTASSILTNFSTTLYSFAIWLKHNLVTTATEASTLSVFGSGHTTNYISMSLNNSNYLFRYKDTGDDVSCTAPQTPGDWVRLVCTVSSDNILRIYKNGSLVNQSAAFSSAANLTATTFIVGQLTGLADLIGEVDSVQVWRGVSLTASEVSLDYFYGVMPQQSSLIVDWKLNETAGSSALDSSGNGNTGTITGATYTADVKMIARSIA